MITQPFTAVTMVCLYSKVISVHKVQRTGGQQVGENITDGGTMLMKRAREKNVGRKKKKKKPGVRKSQTEEGRPGSERR